MCGTPWFITLKIENWDNWNVDDGVVLVGTCEVAGDEDEGGVDGGESGAHEIAEEEGSVWVVNTEMEIGELNHPNHWIRPSLHLLYSHPFCASTCTAAANATRDHNGSHKEAPHATSSALGWKNRVALVIFGSQFHFTVCGIGMLLIAFCDEDYE